MCCRSLFAAMRSIAGRSRRIERDVADIRAILLSQSKQLTRMETNMARDTNELLNEAKEVHAAITALVQSKAADIDAAVAKAKAAWEADDAAEHDAALAELRAIKAELASPPPFSPSAN